MKKLSIALITIFTIMVSCKKDSENNSGNNSRTLRYEVTGNFTGKIFISYTTQSGGTANDEISALPFGKEITFDANVTAAVVALTGNGGVAGQKVTLIRKRGGTQIGQSIQITANSSGSFSEGAPGIVL